MRRQVDRQRQWSRHATHACLLLAIDPHFLTPEVPGSSIKKAWTPDLTRATCRESAPQGGPLEPRPLLRYGGLCSITPAETAMATMALTAAAVRQQRARRRPAPPQAETQLRQ